MHINLPDSLLELLSTFSFRGNKRLRPKGAVIEYTEEMLDELSLCKADPVYFIEKYCKVIHVDRGLVPFILHDYQKRMITAYKDNRFVCTMASRQLGKTVCVAAFFCWFVLFHDEKTTVILANKAAVSREILSRVQIMYEHLPRWIQQGVTSWNKGSIELENNSRILCGATSSTGYRGFSIALLYLDEYAFVPNNVADEFYTSMFPTLSSGEETKMILSSTPNGYNHFHKIWHDANTLDANGNKKSIFTPVLCMWHEHPDRNERWAAEQLLALGEVKYAQEVTCDFVGSSLTLLRGETLSRLTYENPLKEYDGEFKGLKVYKYPEKNKVYCTTVDTSRGRHLDSSAFAVFDISQFPHTIAATYRNSDVAPLMYASVVDKISRNYNNSYLLIEINDIGAQVAETIYMDLEYDGDMFWTKSGDNLGKVGNDPYPGIRTTKKTKRIGCANLKDMIENNQLLINDFDMISELSTFIQKGTGSYEADEGFHDDTVTTLWLHAWLVSQPFFNQLTDQNVRLAMHQEHINEMEDRLMMTTYYSDGIDEVIEREESTMWSAY